MMAINTAEGTTIIPVPKSETVPSLPVDFFIRRVQTLDNFSALPLRWKGYTFKTSEAVYQWEKINGVTQEHRLVQKMLMEIESVYDLPPFLVESRHLRVPDWGIMKKEMMGFIFRTKYKQHAVVREVLRGSTGKILIEGNHQDAYWGTGPNGNGQNVAGKLWQTIRDEDKSRYTSTLWDTCLWEPVSRTFTYKQI